MCETVGAIDARALGAQVEHLTIEECVPSMTRSSLSSTSPMRDAESSGVQRYRASWRLPARWPLLLLTEDTRIEDAFADGSLADVARPLRSRSIQADASAVHAAVVVYRAELGALECRPAIGIGHSHLGRTSREPASVGDAAFDRCALRLGP